MPNGTVATLPRLAIVDAPHRPPRPSLPRSIAAFLGHALLAATLLTAGTALCAAALLVAVVTAPVAASGVMWLMWRLDEGEAEQRARRVRARIRRRTRALGLRVLASSR